MKYNINFNKRICVRGYCTSGNSGETTTFVNKRFDEQSSALHHRKVSPLAKEKYNTLFNSLKIVFLQEN